MWPNRTLFRPKTDVLVLEANAARAGYALACPYSCSDEFEAAIIRAQRAAGVYGPKRQRRQLAGIAGAIALVALLLWIV